MEIWFWYAIIGAILAGVSNFYFKQAASRGYSAEIFSLWGGAISVLMIAVALLIYPPETYRYGLAALLVFGGGLLAASTGIMKVYALRYIDSTIYFPLFKLLAPSLAIILGIMFFAERFTWYEWIGMTLGLLVPLLLITNAEKKRQANLVAGLLLVFVTGLLSAVVAGLNKFGIGAGITVLSLLLYAASGVLLGTAAIMFFKSGVRQTIDRIKSDTSSGLIFGAGLRVLLINISLGFTLLAYATGGSLGIVQTIHSMYILIPIILSIIFYNEHWNAQKVVAVALSVAALALLG